MENKRYKFMNDVLESKNYKSLDQIWGAVLFNVAKDYPADKRKLLMAGPFQQRCYLDAMESLANSDINIKNIKTPVLAL